MHVCDSNLIRARRGEELEKDEVGVRELQVLQRSECVSLHDSTKAICDTTAAEAIGSVIG